MDTVPKEILTGDESLKSFVEAEVKKRSGAIEKSLRATCKEQLDVEVEKMTKEKDERARAVRFLQKEKVDRLVARIQDLEMKLEVWIEKTAFLLI